MPHSFSLFYRLSFSLLSFTRLNILIQCESCTAIWKNSMKRGRTLFIFNINSFQWINNEKTNPSHANQCGRIQLEMRREYSKYSSLPQISWVTLCLVIDRDLHFWKLLSKTVGNDDLFFLRWSLVRLMRVQRVKSRLIPFPFWERVIFHFLSSMRCEWNFQTDSKFFFYFFSRIRSNSTGLWVMWVGLMGVDGGELKWGKWMKEKRNRMWNPCVYQIFGHPQYILFFSLRSIKGKKRKKE